MTTRHVRRFLLAMALVGAPMALAACDGDSLSGPPRTVVIGDGMY